MATISAKEAAEAIGTDPKTLRRFVRSYVKAKGGEVGQDTPGRGGRYAFEEDELPRMQDAFHAWQAKGGRMLVTFSDESADDES